MGNTHSKLNNFINYNNNNDNSIVKKIVLLCSEYLSILNNYNITDSKWTNEDRANTNSTINIITRTINKFKETLDNELSTLTEFMENISNINDNTNFDEETETILKTFADLLIEQISKIHKHEMIAEGVSIMMKQTDINYEQATQYLIENNYDAVSALLSYMNHKSCPETKTYFTFNLNQYELVNELVSLSPSLIYNENKKLSNTILDKVQSYVCILINDINNISKIKKYASLSELYRLFIKSKLENISSISFKINEEEFALLLNLDNIISVNTTEYINKPITVILRNMEFITNEQYYTGPALFINNFFLN
jgi:iron-sulfur cluster repair protein YtfE (RIC family)